MQNHATWPTTLMPSQLTSSVSLPIGCFVYTYHYHLLLILIMKADTRGTVPQRVEGGVAVGMVVRVSTIADGCIALWL